MICTIEMVDENVAFLEVDNKDELISFYSDMLLKEKKDGFIFYRDDYREAAKLALVLIGGQLPEGQMMAYKKNLVKFKQVDEGENGGVPPYLAICRCYLQQF